MSWSVTAIVREARARPTPAPGPPGDERPSDAVVWRWRSITPGPGRGAARGRAGAAPGAGRAPGTPGSAVRGAPRSSLANSRKTCLPSESSNRSPYRLKKRCDARSHRMPIISACWSSTPRATCSAPGGEEAVGGALEEQERRPRLEPRVLREQLLVALLERRQVLPLLVGELLRSTVAAARVARRARGARVELEARPLGGDRDAQRVAREEQFGRHRVGRRLPPGPALLARPVDLQHALPRPRSSARRRSPRSAPRCPS